MSSFFAADLAQTDRSRAARCRHCARSMPSLKHPQVSFRAAHASYAIKSLTPRGRSARQAAAERALRWRRGGDSGSGHRPDGSGGDAFAGDGSGGAGDRPRFDPGSDSMRAWNWSQWSKTVSVDVAWMMAAEVTANHRTKAPVKRCLRTCGASAHAVPKPFAQRRLCKDCYATFELARCFVKHTHPAP